MTFQPQKHVTSRYPKVIPYTSFEHFEIIIIVNVHLLTLWPWPLTFQPQNHVTFRISQGHSQPILSLNTEIISFWVMLRTNKQTNKQTDKHKVPNVLPTHADSVDSNCLVAIRHLRRRRQWHGVSSSHSLGRYRQTKARFPFKRNRLRCVRCANENRKKRKRLRWQAANHGCHCSTEHSYWLALAFVAWK